MANFRDLIQAINQEATNVASLDVRIRVSVFTDSQLNELVDTVRAVYTSKDQQRVITQRVVRRVNAAHPLKVASFDRSTKAYAFIDKATIRAAKDAAKAIKDAGKESPAAPATAAPATAAPASASPASAAPATASAAPATASAAPASSPASVAPEMVRASALAEAIETIEALLKTVEALEMQSTSAKVGTGKKASLKKAA